MIVAAACVACLGVYAQAVRRRSIALLEASIQAKTPLALAESEEPGWLARWLALAGFRRPQAPAFFLAALGVAATAGVLAVFAVDWLGIPDDINRTLSGIPGGVGDAFRAIALLAPWIVFVTLANVPWLAVRAARRRRVNQIEQDLSLVLELFATLAEAGLSFDAALARIQKSHPAERALSEEFRIYQQEIQSGVPRLQCLRGLARRTEVIAIAVLVSALIQAEQIGASLSETLRHQSNDLRDRRHAQVLMLAQALSAKLVFPLVLCFLPGIFVSTLGPALQQLIKVADGVMRQAR